MGNSCVSGGGTPHRVDITLINDSPLDLMLDSDMMCQTLNPGCEDKHLGFGAKHGKFIADHLPPQRVPGRGGVAVFSAAGREGSAVCPDVVVQYKYEGAIPAELKTLIAEAEADAEKSGGTNRPRASNSDNATLVMNLEVEATGWTALQNDVQTTLVFRGSHDWDSLLEYSVQGGWHPTIRIKLRSSLLRLSVRSRVGNVDTKITPQEVHRVVQLAVDAVIERTREQIGSSVAMAQDDAKRLLRAGAATGLRLVLLLWILGILTHWLLTFARQDLIALIFLGIGTFVGSRFMPNYF